MVSLSSSLLAAVAMLCVACAPPPPAYTVRTLLHPQVGSRDSVGSSEPTTQFQLTPCAQAILGCCPPEVRNRQECFEQVGCGPHIFGDPCAEPYMRKALGGAETFYNQFTSVATNNIGS